MRKRVMAALLALALGVAATATAAAELGGRYVGVDAAEGMSIEIAEGGGGFRGSITDKSGRAAPFEAERLQGRAQGVADFGAFRALVSIRPEPIGALAVITPLDAEGRPEVDQTRALPFLREGVERPEAPVRYRPAPERPARAFDARAFAASYPFWPAQGAAYAYEGVEPRLRTVIRLFPLVQTDLLWKLCQAPEPTPGLAEALRGQNVTCAEVLGSMRAAQAGEGFDRFKRDVAAERETLMQALDCANDYTGTDRACEAAGAETARRALSMETAATVLSRYR